MLVAEKTVGLSWVSVNWLRVPHAAIVPLSASERQRGVVRGAIHDGNLDSRCSSTELWHDQSL